MRHLALSNHLDPDCPYNDELNLELTADDVDEVLALMPALRTLELGYTQVPPAVAARLRTAAPQLAVSVTPLPAQFRSESVVERKARQEEARFALLDRWLDARRAAGLPEWQGWRDMPLMDYELEEEIQMLESGDVPDWYE